MTTGAERDARIRRARARAGERAAWAARTGGALPPGPAADARREAAHDAISGLPRLRPLPHFRPGTVAPPTQPPGPADALLAAEVLEVAGRVLPPGRAEDLAVWARGDASAEDLAADRGLVAERVLERLRADAARVARACLSRP